ncbi:hypothetical protein [Plantactinospora sp. GCM10030261]|uniref:hypothetical protein n=1 Tax=Plantactinospora sp. GCM10030261 TaxID=3273420 RepID=UPI00360680A7
MRTPGQGVGFRPPARGSAAVSTTLPPEVDLRRYRDAVADLLAELGRVAAHGDHRRAAALVAARATDPELRAVLRATPDGPDDAVDRLLREIADYRPNARSSATDLLAMVRIFLLSRIDVLWWGDVPPYLTDIDVRRAPDLVDLDPLRRRGLLRFRYRRQADGLAGRAVRSVGRRLLPDRQPRTAGLRFAQARPAMIALLNQLADDFAARAPRSADPLWVTSLVRSLQHQLHLRTLGYTALLPSSHCSGYAVDVEMAWYRRTGADTALSMLLLERQRAGDINVIDEGQAWHVCVGPAAVGPLTREYATVAG